MKHGSALPRGPAGARTPSRLPSRPTRGTPDGAGSDVEIERLIFDHISDAIFATDAANRVTYWSPSAERLFGYTASEAIGRAFGDLLPFRMPSPDDERAFFADLAAGRTWRGRGTVRLRDGGEIWLESTVQPIVTQGQLVGSVSVARDITTTIEAQRQVAEQERFINAVLDVEGALVIVADAAGRVVRFNGACERLTGYRAADVVGRPFWDAVPADEIAAVRATVADLQAGNFPNTHENHWLTRDGSQRLIRWENTCLTDERGQVTHVIATGIDITEARHADEALRGIEAVGRLLAEQGPVAHALDAVLAELQQRMGYALLTLYMRDAGGDSLRLGAQRGYAGVPDHIDQGRGIVGRVFRSAEATLVPDVRLDADYVPGDSGVVAELAVPLVGDGETLGVLNVESTTRGGLTAADLQLIRAVADRLSSALLLHARQGELRDRAGLFAALATFAVVANAILDPTRLATALVDAVSTVVPSDTIVVTILDREDGQFRVRAVRGLADDAVGAIIRPGDGNTGRAIVERAVSFSDRHRRDHYASVLRDWVPYDSLSGVAVPLIHEGEVLGVISLGRAGPTATFTETEREVLAIVGSQAALALANAYLVEEVSALAIHDGLTGLFNRRHFDAAADLAIARYRRRAPVGTLAAIMFDLDHFGQFNRSHGHVAGDDALRLFGGILRERLRSADLVARYGGEEFIVILEDSDLPGVVRVAEDIRTSLEARPILAPDGTSLKVTVSAGCAMIDPTEPTLTALVSRADVGLFMAKRAGRNRVVAA
jgi:diguanylate cyclase (GGDEF)-like protein/PAS domain S-box-containing protein